MRSSKPVFPPPPPHHQEFLAKLAGKQRAAAGQAESSRPKPEKYVTSLSGVKRPPAQEAVDGAVAELPKTRPQPKQHSSFYAASNKAAAPAVAVVHDDIGKSGASLPTRAASLVATSRAAPADGPLVATPSVPGTTHSAAAAAAGDDSISVNAAGPVLTSPTRTAAGAAAGAASGAEAHSALLSADQGAARCPRLAPLAVRGGAPRGDFRLQQQAFEFLDVQGADLAPALRVFGRELSADGKRRFLVTSPARLWAEEVEPAAPLGQQQGTAGACGLHLYEIIREGAPCHLYFDLEYVPALNPGVCGDSLVDLLLDLVAEELASSCRVRLPLLGSRVGGGGAAVAGAAAASQKDGVSALAVGAAAEGGAGAGAQPGTGAGAVETADDGGAGRDVAVLGSETGPSSSPESAPTTQQVAGTEAAATAVAAGGETQEAAAGSGTAAAVVSVVAVGDTAAWASTTATGAAPGAGAASAGEGQVTDMKIDMAEVRLHSGPAAVATGAATPSSSACQPALTALEAMAEAQAGTAAGQDTALSAGTASPVSAPDTAAATATANLDYPADAVAQPVTAVDPSGTGAAQGGSAAPVAPPHAGRVECPWAWELCSTTEAKWSRHLIVRIPHCAFKDNFHVNAFVRRLFDRIAADPQRFAPFFVRRCADPAAPPTLFIDPAVYTRNRAFRLYLSCKAGKTAVLRATPRHAVASLLRRRGLLATAPVHKAPSAGARGSSSSTTSSTAISGGVGSALLPPQVEREIAEEVFFATLVTTVGRVDRTLTMYDDSAASHGGAGLNTFHANANAAAAAADAAGGAAAQGAAGDAWSGIPRLPLPGLGRGGRGGGGGGGGGGEWRRGPGEAFHYGASPFPEVERFIESVCKEGGVQGRVRSWQHHADSTGGGAATLLLGVRDNRWCANVGRPHRSNGIYYLVDLRGGTWCQRCHDPDCRDFRSAAMPLPADVWEACRPKDTPSPPPAPPAPPQQICGPARPPGPESGLAAPVAPQPQLRPSALQFERVGPPCAPAAAPRAATAPWGARTAGNGPGNGNAMDEGIGVGGQGAELGAGITPNGVTSGVGYGIEDVDSDAVFDMMCVEALERLERQQAGDECKGRVFV